MNPPTDPAIEEARLAGFDMNLIEINLSLPPRNAGGNTIWRWT
jgi:hypothetical protein